jgi:hypothetical protein
LARTPGTDDVPVWGADGRAVYNVTHTGNVHQLIRHWVDGSGGREILFERQGPELLALHDVTADGRSAILKEGATVHRLDLAAPEPRKLEPLFDVPGAGAQVRLSRDGRMIVATSDAKILAWPYPPDGTPAKEIAVANSQPIWPFFSEDSRSLFVATDDALYSYPVLPGIRLGERTHLFRLIHSVRINAHIAQASRDGSRILAITTDDVEEFRTQVLSDWTTLLPK